MVLGGSVLLVVAAIATPFRWPATVSPELRLVCSRRAAGLVVAWERRRGDPRRIAAGALLFLGLRRLAVDRFRRDVGGLALSDIANEPLPLMAAVPARSLTLPTSS